MTLESCSSESLLAVDEPSPFCIVNATGACPLVLVCDHASNRIPRGLQNLGLSPQTLETHIAWDPGAASVARSLSRKLDAPLVLSNYSRLVIDCNRPPTSPESIPQESAGVRVPGNCNLLEGDRKQRRESVFNPYQQAIAQLLEKRKTPTALLSVHSFTPSLNGEDRPWQIGVAYFQDARLARALYQGLEQSTVLQRGEATEVEPKLQLGFNQPYRIEAEFDHTVPVQGEARAIPSAMVEIRQDEIGDSMAVEHWADILATAWGSARSVLDK